MVGSRRCGGQRRTRTLAARPRMTSGSAAAGSRNGPHGLCSCPSRGPGRHDPRPLPRRRDPERREDGRAGRGARRLPVDPARAADELRRRHAVARRPARPAPVPDQGDLQRLPRRPRLHRQPAARHASSRKRRAGDTDPGASSPAGAFNTPQLRDLRNTAPYMHNGSIGTLREVVEFYDQRSSVAPLRLTRRRSTISSPSSRSCSDSATAAA